LHDLRRQLPAGSFRRRSATNRDFTGHLTVRFFPVPGVVSADLLAAQAKVSEFPGRGIPAGGEKALQSSPDSLTKKRASGGTPDPLCFNY
jgi:hypothetical protein